LPATPFDVKLKKAAFDCSEMSVKKRVHFDENLLLQSITKSHNKRTLKENKENIENENVGSHRKQKNLKEYF